MIYILSNKQNIRLVFNYKKYKGIENKVGMNKFIQIRNSN